ncbi:MAG TPA: DHHA1 domain-containing protein, partial [Chthoniobacterales bacterium]|nr:DHHA1 domain-containing protein [Chthoniobacterales bacterium]
HWALHEVVSNNATQKGSYVGPEKLTFDFSSASLPKEKVRSVDKLVNEKVREDAPVSWTEIAYSEAKQRKDIQQFFGEKYGDIVRVVQIGGEPGKLNGYSMELCGGTHVRSTSEIGAFRIVKEEAIAAGIRRIEAVAGESAREWAKAEARRQDERFAALQRKTSDVASLPRFDQSIDTAVMLEQIDARAVHLEKVDAELREWEKQRAKAGEAELRRRAADIAKKLAAKHASSGSLVEQVSDADANLLQAIADALRVKINGPILLVSAVNGVVGLVASVPKEQTTTVAADKLIQQLAPIVGGKGGGRPENARGAGKEIGKIEMLLAEARRLLSSSAKPL